MTLEVVDQFVGRADTQVRRYIVGAELCVGTQVRRYIVGADLWTGGHAGPPLQLRGPTCVSARVISGERP